MVSVSLSLGSISHIWIDDQCCNTLSGAKFFSNECLTAHGKQNKTHCSTWWAHIMIFGLNFLHFLNPAVNFLGRKTCRGILGQKLVDLLTLSTIWQILSWWMLIWITKVNIPMKFTYFSQGVIKPFRKRKFWSFCGDWSNFPNFYSWTCAWWSMSTIYWACQCHQHTTFPRGVPRFLDELEQDIDEKSLTPNSISKAALKQHWSIVTKLTCFHPVRRCLVVRV
jgi:hypothetical protein